MWGITRVWTLDLQNPAHMDTKRVKKNPVLGLIFTDCLRPPRGVCGACLHQVHKPSAIGAILSQTYGNV